MIQLPIKNADGLRVECQPAHRHHTTHPRKLLFASASSLTERLFAEAWALLDDDDKDLPVLEAMSRRIMGHAPLGAKTLTKAPNPRVCMIGIWQNIGRAFLFAVTSICMCSTSACRWSRHAVPAPARKRRSIVHCSNCVPIQAGSYDITPLLP